MSKIQIILIVVFVIAMIVALLIFGNVIKINDPEEKNFAELEIWGTIPKKYFKDFIDLINNKNKKFFNITYKEKDSSNYEEELLDALASGKGPDMWMITQDMISKYKNKVFLIPYESFSKRDLKNMFIEESELLFQENGIVGAPFIIDPLVMYWNRDIFSSAGITQPSETWDEFIVHIPKLTIQDKAGNFIQNGAALGEYSNVKHTKDIVSMLILQTGNPIFDINNNEITLENTSNIGIVSAEEALRFFTSFSNPNKNTYSWNRTLPESDIAFTNGSLAVYFGYASEVADIQKRNPHLNFDVAIVPQIKDGKIKATFGKMQSIVINKSSPDISTAFNAVFSISDAEAFNQFSQNHLLIPVRRDILGKGNQDPTMSIFYKSAILSRAWVEMDSQKTSKIFQNMIESISTGKLLVPEAINRAQIQLTALLNN